VPNDFNVLATVPPKTPQEIAESEEICRQLREFTHMFRQPNLDRAIILAQMVARHHGPLVEHFAELGADMLIC
jgi:hypothetical protein